jgi:hypothetical protein
MKDYYMEYVKNNLSAAEAFAAVYNLLSVQDHIPAEDLDQDMLQQLKQQKRALEEEIAILYVQEKGLIYNEYLGKYVTKKVESSSCL